MAAAAAPAPPPRREDPIDRAWALASSPRAAAALALALVAATGAALILAPAEEPAPGSAAALLELDDPFHSWWVTPLLAALTLSVLAFAVDRLPGEVLAVLRPSRRLTAAAERGLRLVRRLQAGADGSAEAGRVAAAFRARGFEPRMDEEGGARYLFAERGRWARFGEWVALVGLLLLLGAGLAGRLLEWNGTAELEEGVTAAEVSRRAPGRVLARQPLPLAVRLNRVEVERGRAGAPVAVRADVSLVDARGREVRRETLDGGRWLRQAGMVVDLAGWRELPGGARASLRLVDRQAGVGRAVRVGRGEPIQAGPVTFSVEEYFPAWRDLGPALRMRRTEEGGSTEFLVFRDHPDFDARNRPDRWTVQFEGLRNAYAAALRVGWWPTTPWLLGGAALLAAGLAAALSGAHRRLWARVEPGAIALAGASHRRSQRLERTLDEIRRELAPAGGA